MDFHSKNANNNCNYFIQISHNDVSCLIVYLFRFRCQTDAQDAKAQDIVLIDNSNTGHRIILNFSHTCKLQNMCLISINVSATITLPC